MKPVGSDAPVDAGDAQRRVSEGAGIARASRFAASEMTPLVIGGRMYISTPYSRVAALDATTGKEIWVRDIPGPGQPSLCGVEYWPGDGQIGPRIVFGTRDGRLIALDAATGAWAPGSTQRRSGVNVWGFLSLDEKRGIVYLPIAAPAVDRYGGDRVGDNLFSSSLIAVDAKTGRYLWHFQIVHHDIWDIDLESAPLLFDAHISGRTVPAVAVVAKNALLFMLDRVTGEPIHPVEERPVPPSTVPGEVASPTQPFPITPPLARTSFSIEHDIANVTPELKTWCENWIRENRMVEGGLYRPMRLDQPVITFPGTEGGSNWGGAAYDPKSGYIFVNTSNFGQVTTLVKSNGPVAYQPGGLGGRFQQPSTGLMCQRPPWVNSTPSTPRPARSSGRAYWA